MRIPKPKGWTEYFTVISRDEIIPCKCGKLSTTIDGFSGHSAICDMAKTTLSELASFRRNGLAQGTNIARCRYYASIEAHHSYRVRYVRALKKFKRRKNCEYCGRICYPKAIAVRTCSANCSSKLMVSKRDYKESAIRGAATRGANLDYHPTAWNKGMSGDTYLEFYRREGETLDDTKARITKGFLAKSSIEEKIAEILDILKIAYTRSVFIARRSFDFKLVDYNILIEADGDYWHGNIEKFPNLTDRQIQKQTEDRDKDLIARKYGYKILRFWETDINEKNTEVRRLIKEITNGNEKALRQVEINYTCRCRENLRHYSAG